MSINFVQGQVAQGDPNPGGPSATSNVKDVRVKVVKLTSANFTTTNVDTLLAVLPADATVLGIDQYVKVQLAGGSVSAATITLGSASGGSQFSGALSVFGAAGTSAPLSPLQGLMQNYAWPIGSDIQIWGRGIATTGNPTSGEVYLTISYVR
jgi:hypothetical protein